MNEFHLWMKVSSIDKQISSMDESVIYGCHPWMTSKNEDNRWQTATQYESQRSCTANIYSPNTGLSCPIFSIVYSQFFNMILKCWKHKFCSLSSSLLPNILLDYNGIRNTGKTCTFHSQNITAITTPSKDKYKIVKTLNWRKVQIPMISNLSP